MEPGSIRDQLKHQLKQAILQRDKLKIATLRLMTAAIKDRDIVARGKGSEAIDEPELLQLLTKMINQRQESAAIYQKAERQELADQELSEIEIIKTFMPPPLSDEEISQAIDMAITVTQSQSMRDMGKVVGELKAQYPGRIDFTKASKLIKDKLSGAGTS